MPQWLQAQWQRYRCKRHRWQVLRGDSQLQACPRSGCRHVLGYSKPRRNQMRRQRYALSRCATRCTATCLRMSVSSRVRTCEREVTSKRAKLDAVQRSASACLVRDPIRAEAEGGRPYHRKGGISSVDSAKNLDTEGVFASAAGMRSHISPAHRRMPPRLPRPAGMPAEEGCKGSETGRSR